MGKTSIAFIVVLIITIILGIGIIMYISEMGIFEGSEGPDKIIGGDRDSQGCLGSAGYNWNEDEKECVREWETGDARYQVNDFDSCVNAGYAVMESYPRKCRTDGGREFVEVIIVKDDNHDDTVMEEEDDTWIDHSDREETYCKEEQRNAGACITLYDPVCGFFDGAKIQCIKAPCAQDYSNSCEACADSNVLYWIEGNCPST